MTRIIMAYVGVVNGVKAYAPMDQSDVDAIGDNAVIVADMKGERAMRTTLQNRSIHKYWSIICEKLNNGGWTKKKYYEVKEVDIEWTPESVGDDIWRGIQEAMFGHRKTSKLEPEQVTRVYEVMDRHLNNTCTVSHYFPNKRDRLDDQQHGAGQ